MLKKIIVTSKIQTLTIAYNPEKPCQDGALHKKHYLGYPIFLFL